MRAPWKRVLVPPEQGAKTVAKHRSNRLSAYLKFFGPAVIASVAYIDPGNFGTDISAGASYGYVLLWSVLLANLMGILLQYLSGKIGIATNKSLSELSKESLGSRRRTIPYWLACETFAVFTDLAEFLGVTSALWLLTGPPIFPVHEIPLLVSAWISAFDVFVIFGLAGKKFRRIELIITTLVFSIGLGYIYEIFLVKPSAAAVVGGIVIPTVANSNQLLLIVGIIGATVMPHALVIQSWLTKNRVVENSISEKRRLLSLHRFDTILNLSVAGLINMALLIMAAAAFFVAGLNVATINDAYKTLIPLFGLSASVVFGLTLLCSGWSSSVVGVMAGQAMLEGLLGVKINPWLRRIIIRGINVVPTSIAISLGFDPLILLVYSQVVLSFLIPLPLIPLIYYTARKKFMGQFVNRHSITFLALVVAAVIVVLNVALLYTTI